MTNHSSRFQRQGFMILIICSAMMLGIGIHMFVVNSSSTSIITSRFRNPIEQTIMWHTPIAGSLILLILAIFIKLDRPTLPKIDVKGKRQFIYDQIADLLQENDFGKRGYNFFKKNGTVGYCINIQNYKNNNAGQIQFTLNFGIFTERFWLQHLDFKKTGVAPKFPKVEDCAIKERICNLPTQKDDKWYYISSDTNVMKLLNEIERDIVEYAFAVLQQIQFRIGYINGSIHLSGRR